MSTIGLVLLCATSTLAFTLVCQSRRTAFRRQTSFLGAHLQEKEASVVVESFDPFHFSKQSWNEPKRVENLLPATTTITAAAAVAAGTAVSVLTLSPGNALAAGVVMPSSLPAMDMNPQNFQPVCPASDGFYRFLQGSTEAVVGRENFVEYGPLIAGGLLRVRLELCVIESFFNEAVGPFVQQNGISWILPLHETVETFLAGTIFSLATTFILVGSTKLVSVIVTYADVFLGVPSRVLGGFAFDRARGKPVTLDIGFGPFKTRVIGPPDEVKDEAEDNDKLVDFDNVSPVGIVVILISGVVKLCGEALKLAREIMEGIDLFVGRYLVLLATGYIGFKFLHFKLFPDFPPF